MKQRISFTLIELLIVISIISILASILLPALRSSRDRAQGAFCRNNIKSQVTGFIMYADNYNDHLPMGENFDNGGSGNYSCFANIANGYREYSFFAVMQPQRKWNLAGYFTISGFNGELKDLKILTCPSDTSVVYGRDFSTDKYPAATQTISYSYRGVTTTPSGTQWEYANYKGPDRISQAIKPILADRIVGSRPVAHKQEYNIGFTDGCVMDVKDQGQQIRSYGLLWKRSSIWKIFDATR